MAGNEELHRVAVAELQQRIAASGAGDPATFAEATAALAMASADLANDQTQPEQASRPVSNPAGTVRRRWKNWRKQLGIVTLLVSLPLLAGVLVHFVSGLGLIRGLGGVSMSKDGPQRLVERIVKGRSPSERLLLVGEPDVRKDAERWRPLWESEPKNPAYLAEYALAFLRTSHEVSPEILETAGRIDPDNGWFIALAAAGKADGSVKKGTRTSEQKREGKAIAWQVLDEPRLRDALLQLHQAAAKPRFTGYRTQLHQARVRLLPPQVDWMSHLAWLAYVGYVDTSAVIQFRHLSDAIAAGAEQCAIRQDAEGFRQIVADWRWLTAQVIQDDETLIGQLVARVLFTAPLANFRDAAAALGMKEDAAQFGALDELERTEREAREKSSVGSANSELARSQGSLFGALAMATPSVIQSPPEVTAAELEPGRLTDHAVFDRISATLIWLILGVGVLNGVKSSRGRAEIRALSVRLQDLLRPSDWAWVLLGGVVLPLVWYVGVTRLTPLSAREWSLTHTGILLPLYQKAALALLLVIGPLVMAGWRLGKRGTVVGFALTRSWPGWLAVAAAALAIPGLGGLVLFASEPDGKLVASSGWLIPPWWWFQGGAGLLVGLPLCWLVAVIFQSLGRAKNHQLRRATVARAAVPGWLCGMLLAALALPLHQAEERYWFSRETLHKVPLDRAVFSEYEARVALTLRAETLARMAKLKID